MPIITDKELSEEKRALWLKALSAVELRNYGYAISLALMLASAIGPYLYFKKRGWI